MIDFDCSLSRNQFAFKAAFESDAGITGLFGPSGSGKSTIIQLIAGLVRPARGRILVDGKVLVDTEHGVRLPPHKRGVGLVFQDAQLFPHLSVRQNLTYGRFFAPARNESILLSSVIDVLGIGHLLDRSPQTLSGGERQRVAIGRALYSSPTLLLMDEPLASLDTDRKLEILPFIESLRDEFSIPILYVSHSVEEIARLATTVVRIENGAIVSVGSPDAVLSPQAVPRSGERFEAVSTVSGTFQHYDAEFGVSSIKHPAGVIVVPGRITATGVPVRVVVRATNISLSAGRPEHLSIRSILAGRIVRIDNSGPYALVAVELKGGDRIIAYVTRLAIHNLGLSPGDEVHALVKSVAIDELGVSGLQRTAAGSLPQ
jgi:molybdate transport system ATP-binding protein